MHPTDDAVRARAFDLWERAGRPDGRDIEFWLQASHDLEEEARAAPPAADAEPVTYALAPPPEPPPAPATPFVRREVATPANDVLLRYARAARLA